MKCSKKVLSLLAEKKKMNCENCIQNEKLKFDEAACVFSCMSDLVIFFLNILLNIKKMVAVLLLQTIDGMSRL